ncbi:MAG: GNAT family N-acetyltransferase [Clostridia bacterium]|nr:GNAT family N-acetyltransferase [Clostridia bacterium]
MTTCTWSTPEDKNDLIDFIDYVFSKTARPHDFATLLPKLYGERGDAASHHIVVREEGRIAATMVAYPVRMRVSGEEILTLGIGSVSVHPRARGKGYMTLMMDALDKRAAETGAVMAVLGGRRQRYEYFGFQKTGLTMQAHLNTANVRHALREVDIAGYSLAPMEQTHVPAALALQASQPCCCLRTEANFIDVLRTWNAEPLTILHGNEIVGCCTVADHDVGELLLSNEAHAPYALKLLSERFGHLTLHAAPWEADRAALLSRICEDFEVCPANQVKFYQPEKARALFAPLGGTDALTWHGFTPSLPVYIPSPDCV